MGFFYPESYTEHLFIVDIRRGGNAYYHAVE